MENFAIGGMFVGLIIMIFYTPACLAMAVDKMNGDREVGNFILSWIPCINIIRAEFKYLGKIGLTGISTLLTIILIVFKLIVYFFMYEQTLINFIALILIVLSIMFMYISNVVLVYTIIKDADVISGFNAFLLSIIFPIGQWYINSGLLSIIREKQEREATFRG